MLGGTCLGHILALVCKVGSLFFHFTHTFSLSLGQLASMAGIDTSDFSPLGRPQLSSTLGHVAQLHGAAPGRRRSHDIQVENCVVVSIWKASCHAYCLKLSLIDETEPNTHGKYLEKQNMKWSLATNCENALKCSFATRNKFATNFEHFIM